jgi:hypothetical protein
MRRYNFDDLWRWLEKIVAACEGNSWTVCVEILRRYFSWEYDNHQEP